MLWSVISLSSDKINFLKQLNAELLIVPDRMTRFVYTALEQWTLMCIKSESWMRFCCITFDPTLSVDQQPLVNTKCFRGICSARTVRMHLSNESSSVRTCCGRFLLWHAHACSWQRTADNSNWDGDGMIAVYLWSYSQPALNNSRRCASRPWREVQVVPKDRLWEYLTKNKSPNTYLG